MASHSNTASTQVDHVLEVSLFGGFELNTFDGAAINPPNRKARALLAILCLLQGGAIERDHVSKLLWPGRFQAQARASLRQCLLSLGKALAPQGADLLHTSHSRIAIDAMAIQSDLARLETALADRRIEDACEILTMAGSKPLLDQMEFGDPFRQWLAVQRQNVEHRLQIAVERTLVMLRTEGDAEGQKLLSDAWRARARPAAPRAEDKRRIAVLPFQQLDEIGGEFFLAEGVVEELSSGLGRISEMAVAGRTSVAAVASSGKTLPEIASALSVSNLIEGSVHRSAENIRINLRLIDGQSGAEIWSDQIGGTIEEILGSRQVIGGNIIAGLCKALGIKPAPLPRRRMTTSREAYSLYLQGRALTFRAIGEGVLEKAIELLESALELDPDFAECWTALAEAHVFTAVYTPCLERIAESERMVECANRAIALDPTQGHAHAMLGIHEWTRQDPVKALDFAFEAYRLEPNNADVTIRLGSFLLYIGRTREALPYLEAAIAQDPIFGRNYAMLCAAHFNLGNIDEAIAAGRRMVDLGMPGMWLATAIALSGDNEAGTEIYYRSRLLMNTVILPPAGTQPMTDEARDSYWRIAANGCCSGKAEDRALYCQMLGGLHATMPDPCDPSVAFPAIWMGHAELAMKIYSEQIHPANMFGLMSLWADIEPIRQIRTHPDFMDFADRIGLVAAWEKYGWPDLIPSDPRTN
ncbi:MAG: tetratricopeptide repeat protein [Alteripontixanthobacter sp.]